MADFDDACVGEGGVSLRNLGNILTEVGGFLLVGELGD